MLAIWGDILNHTVGRVKQKQPGISICHFPASWGTTKIQEFSLKQLEIYYGSAIKSFRKSDELRSKLPNVFWSWVEMPPFVDCSKCSNELYTVSVQSVSWNVHRSIMFLKWFISWDSINTQFTVPSDQNDMLSPPPQPQIPLEMPILSQNAIFLIERVNFYPNNWKFTFLPTWGATKN